ncbi:hypothetical protein [Pseudoclavibacter sp. VKM Ac-2888]|uniref:hypothetical protein n=1 Tax=Pseudoclavibacter sp. VKM Ac-2888 TaxID=2783830 RepID=UPI00188C59F0|nr:hypothetical protein [Pseudoclavibacter sp. VKM Ac-2888]MBF4549248.1 hypothetical protein [Pseudoclavibacter sp. VKM Ac-2888]
MTASIQTTASADNAKTLGDFAREVTGISDEQALNGLSYTNMIGARLSFTVTVVLTEEQAAELNERLGL